MSGEVVNRGYLNIVLWAGAFLLVMFVLFAHHIFTAQKVKTIDPEGVYTPAYLSESWTRFDDLVKINAAENLAFDADITGKHGTREGDHVLAPNVTQQALGSLILAIPMAVTQSAASGFYFSLFCSALCWFLIARLLRYYSLSTLAALAGAAFVIFGYFYLMPNLIEQYFKNPEYLPRTVTFRSSGIVAGNEYNSFFRLHTMSVTYLFLLGLIFYFLKLMDGSEKTGFAHEKKWIVIGALAMAAPFYGYLWHAVAVPFIALGVGARLFWTGLKDKSDARSQGLKIWFFASVLGAILALPSLINLVLLFAGMEADWTARLAGKSKDGAYYGTKALLGVAVLSIIVFRRSNWLAIILPAIFAVLLVENFHILTGVNLQPGHMAHRMGAPLIAITFILVLYRVLSWRGFKTAGTVLATGVIAILGLTSVYFALVWSGHYAERNASMQYLDKDQRELIAFLSGLEKGVVVGTLDPQIDSLLLHQAKLDSFQTFSGHMAADTANRDIEKRLALLMWLTYPDGAGERNEDVHRYFKPGGRAVPYERYAYYYFARQYAPYGKVSTDVLADKVSQQLADIDGDSDFRPASSAQWPDIIITGGPGEGLAPFQTGRPNFMVKQGDFGPYSVYAVSKDRR